MKASSSGTAYQGIVFLLVSTLASSVSWAQHGQPSCPNGAPPLWYSGDTHDHIQQCGALVDLAPEICDRMAAEELDVSSVLIWQPTDAQLMNEPYQKHACKVDGVALKPCPGPDPCATLKIIQYGVETSGLNCSAWGHLIGLNISASSAQIVSTKNIGDACYTEKVPFIANCSESQDGTGFYNAPLAQHFRTQDPGAVRGYAHQAWPTEIYHDVGTYGYEWTDLPAAEIADIECLDGNRRLAFPHLPSLLGQGKDCIRPQSTQLFPMLAAMDAALGHIEFLEAVELERCWTGDMPKCAYTGNNSDAAAAEWYGMYYKLLSAGVRISPSGGTDNGCNQATTNSPRTFVRVTGPLTYDKWVNGLQLGRVTLSNHRGLFLELKVDGKNVGSTLSLGLPPQTVTVDAKLYSYEEFDDTIEIVVNGEVDSISPMLSIPEGGGSASFQVSVELCKSSWIAARLTSNRAHTAAVFADLEGSSIVDCETAEYWMVWCNAVKKLISDNPTTLFGCQDTEVMDYVDQARDVFKANRDAALDCLSATGGSENRRASIGIELEGGAVVGKPFIVRCTNAPKDSVGVLRLSCMPQANTPLAGTMPLPGPNSPWVHERVTRSSSEGTAEVRVPYYPRIPPGTALFAQFAWVDPATPGGLRTSKVMALPASQTAEWASAIETRPRPQQAGAGSGSVREDRRQNPH